MKKLIILSAIAMSGLVYNTANAQIGLHIGLHFGQGHVAYAAAPVVVEQAPVVVEQAPVYEQAAPVYNDNSDDYYYLPDVDAYYDVNDQCYFYNDGDNWVSAAYLPGAYRDYDWRNARRYEVRAPRPFMHNDFYRSRYNGHAVPEWNHANYDNHFRGGYGYADHFNRGDDHHFDNRNNGYDQHFDNRGNNQHFEPGFGRGDQRNNQQFDNRGQGGNNQTAQPNRGQDMNNQHMENRGQGGNAQPSNQNNGQRDNRGGTNEHFAQNNSRNGFDHRMSKF